MNAAIQQIQAGAAPLGHYEAFFYPLDKIAQWNRGYGRRGFTQYQFVIPFENGLAQMRKILTAILSSGELPFLNVLKRLGKQSGGVLSFPREGYTFAIDFPVRANTPGLLRRLDAMIMDAGGRIYLGKDSYTEAAAFHTMYPEAQAWLQTKPSTIRSGFSRLTSAADSGWRNQPEIRPFLTRSRTSVSHDAAKHHRIYNVRMLYCPRLCGTKD